VVEDRSQNPQRRNFGSKLSDQLLGPPSEQERSEAEGLTARMRKSHPEAFETPPSDGDDFSAPPDKEAYYRGVAEGIAQKEAGAKIKQGRIVFPGDRPPAQPKAPAPPKPPNPMATVRRLNRLAKMAKGSKRRRW
jgi:hypothetical protein